MKTKPLPKYVEISVTFKRGPKSVIVNCHPTRTFEEARKMKTTLGQLFSVREKYLL